MEEELYTLLANAVSFPIAWGTLGHGTTLPRASMFRTSGVQDYTMSGGGTIRGTVQIDCYGATYAEAVTASRAIRDALAGYRGGAIMGAFLQAVRDGFEDDADLLQRVSLSFSVVYRE